MFPSLPEEKEMKVTIGDLIRYKGEGGEREHHVGQT